MSAKVTRQIVNQPGTISDERGHTVNVRFSLTERQEHMAGVGPGLKSGNGSIEFASTENAFYFFNAGGSNILRGGGIEAPIIVTGLATFEVAGQIKSQSISPS